MLYDVGFIESNAVKYNRPKTDIVKKAKIITRLLKEIVSDHSVTKDDVSVIYHRLQDAFSWDNEADDIAENESEDDEDLDDNQKSSPSRKRRPSR